MALEKWNSPPESGKYDTYDIRGYNIFSCSSGTNRDFSLPCRVVFPMHNIDTFKLWAYYRPYSRHCHDERGMEAGLEIRGILVANASYHVFSFATGILVW